MRNYYKVLGIKQTASYDEIKTIYRKLVFQYHPDQNPYDANASEMFKLINEAYEVLSDQNKRNIYDQELNINNNTISNSNNNPDENTVTTNNSNVNYYKQENERCEFPIVDKYDVSNVVKKILRVDCIVSLFFLLIWYIYFRTLPNVPHVGFFLPDTPFGGANWKDLLLISVYLHFGLSIYVIYNLIKRKKSHFVGYFIICKCFIFVYLLTGIIGLTTVKSSLFWPICILVWNGFAIILTFLYQLDRDMGGNN